MGTMPQSQGEQQSLPVPATLIMKKPGELKNVKFAVKQGPPQQLSKINFYDSLEEDQKNSAISNEEQMGSSND